MRAPRLLPPALAALLLAGCVATGSDAVAIDPQVDALPAAAAPDPGVTIQAGLEYSSVDGTPVLLDACLPVGHDEQSDPVPGILVIHGGSWRAGARDSTGWRAVCQWLAAAGYPAFSIDYRLAPEHPFPAAVDDVQAAVLWLRDRAPLFGVDPDRLGVFGGSAGGNLAAWLGTAGSGDLTAGARVAAVAELSGPIDLTGADVSAEFAPVQLEYLGCAAGAACPAAAAASPGTAIDPTDPPFFVAHSSTEMIDLAQSDRFVAQLRRAGIDVEFVVAEGELHSIALLDDDLEARIVAFYARTLGPGARDLAVPVAGG